MFNSGTTQGAFNGFRRKLALRRDDTIIAGRVRGAPQAKDSWLPEAIDANQQLADGRARRRSLSIVIVNRHAVCERVRWRPQ
jgi:hypothetical protein